MNDPPTTAKPLLTIEDLAVSFDNGPGPRVMAVDGASLTVHDGQTVAVVGESGCGKSVTAMSVLRLVPTPPGRIDRGRAILRCGDEQTDLLKADERAMRQIRGGEIAMIFQEPMTSLNPVYTVGEQICEAVLLHQDVSRRNARDTAVRAMEEVGIDDASSRLGAYPHEFSGGMRQRVMIAMALSCEPRLLLADEPTTALDVTIQAQILDLLKRLQDERGMATLLITHDLGVVAENADVVCVMYAGRVVEYASAEEIFKNPMHPYTRGLFASIPTMSGRRERLETIEHVVNDEDQFRRLPGAADGIRPWWLWHDPPKGMLESTRQCDTSALIEIEPGHWVGLWRTQPTLGLNESHPSLTTGCAAALRA
jgi:oligopeptide transport system ATP-binding protein